MRCAVCSAELPSESAYCSKCGAPTSVAPHRCASCGAELLSESAYCSKCGARNERRVKYSLWRVGILTFLSLGLYYLYWMYVSWKHLAAEMPGKEFHPVWHALSQFVPIYNFVVVYQHFRTIKEVQERERVESNLIPGLAVVLAIVHPIVLPFIILVLWGQRNLNKYWERPGYPPVRSARTGPGEIIITAVGGLITAVYGLIIVIAIMFPPSQSMPIDVDSLRRGTIESHTEVDAYHFTVRGGTRYEIAVNPISSRNLDSAPLEAAIVGLWDSDGTTILQIENGATPIVIPWTASSSGTIYVTIESDGLFARGDYVLRVDAR